MKYKLLKEFPGYKIGDYLNDYDALFKNIHVASFPDFFEPIVEKKTYDSLRSGDKAWYIGENGNIKEIEFDKGDCRSETFLTREEAEDEHKRREFSVRPDKFIPEEEEYYFVPTETRIESWRMTNSIIDAVFINLGLAFRTREECEEAIASHDLICLFYTIR